MIDEIEKGNEKIESIAKMEEYMTEEVGTLPVTLENEKRLKFIIDSLKWSTGEGEIVDFLEVKNLNLNLSEQLKSKFDEKLKLVDQDYKS